MLRTFLILFVVAFVLMAIGAGLGLVRDSSEWLMAECIIVALLATPLQPRIAALLTPADDAFEFEMMDEDDEEIEE